MTWTKQERKRRDELFRQGLKQCSKCGEIKKLEAFDKDKCRYDGRRSSCNACCQKYRDEHREESVTYYRRYREEHREEKAASGRKYNERHKEKIAVIQREYRKKHKERIAARKHKYRKEHREEIAVNQREYYATPRGRAARKAAKHRRRLLPNRSNLSAAIVQEIIDCQNDTCSYCGFPIGECGHIDHIQPVSKGGTNARDNLIYCCAGCNMSKGDKSLAEWQAIA